MVRSEKAVGLVENSSEVMKFFIGNDIIEHDKLYAWARHISEDNSSQWIKDIAEFLLDWGNDSSILVVKTSGSTGKPKNIELSKDAMRRSALLTKEQFKLKKGRTSLNCLPSAFIAGKMMIVRALVIGMNQVCIQPKLELKWNNRHSLDFAAFTPLQFSRTFKQNPQAIKDIHIIILGGAPVSRRIKDMIGNLKNKVFATYGMTETITHVAVQALNGPDRSEYFTGLKGIRFNQKGGNLVIHAPHLKDSIITNDQVNIINQLHFEWLGRSDNIINRGGVKLNPEVIEDKLSNVIKQRLIIVGAEDEDLGNKLVLVIENPFGNADFILEINEQIQILKKLERPDHLIVVDELKETSTGKIIRDLELYL